MILCSLLKREALMGRGKSRLVSSPVLSLSTAIFEDEHEPDGDRQKEPDADGGLVPLPHTKREVNPCAVSRGSRSLPLRTCTSHSGGRTVNPGAHPSTGCDLRRPMSAAPPAPRNPLHTTRISIPRRRRRAFDIRGPKPGSERTKRSAGTESRRYDMDPLSRRRDKLAFIDRGK